MHPPTAREKTRRDERRRLPQRPTDCPNLCPLSLSLSLCLSHTHTHTHTQSLSPTHLPVAQVIATHPSDEDLPSLDLHCTQYFFRHASARAAAEALAKANPPLSASAALNLSHEKPIVGSGLPKAAMQVRLPAPHELENIPSEFSKWVGGWVME